MRLEGPGFRVQGSVFLVSDSEFWVSGLGGLPRQLLDAPRGTLPFSSRRRRVEGPRVSETCRRTTPSAAECRGLSVPGFGFRVGRRQKRFTPQHHVVYAAHKVVRSHLTVYARVQCWTPSRRITG